MKMTVALGSATVWLRDGTQMSFTPSVNDEWRCTQIKDRNGNFISVTYTAQGNINTVTDTLGRQMVFNYDANNRLLTITQNRTGLDDTLVTFGYENASFNPAFSGLYTFAPTTSTSSTRHLDRSIRSAATRQIIICFRMSVTTSTRQPKLIVRASAKNVCGRNSGTMDKKQ
jgi:YD repeat-containing protein